MRQRLVPFALALLVVVAAAGYAWYDHRQHDVADPQVQELLASAYPDGDGQAQALAQWKGRLLVVNFWATWCAPCIEEMPDLQRIQDDYAARGVVVLGLGAEDAAKLAPFRREHGLRLPLLAVGLDGLELARALGDEQGVLPYTVVIAPDGRVLHRHTGRVPVQQLRSWLDARG